MRRHMKRLNAPYAWHTTKKTSVWVTKPSPGPHPAEKGMPLINIVRDILGYADSAAEARRIIGGREIIVDGAVCTDYRRPVGFMDVVSIPKTKEHYRVLYDRNGYLRLQKITADRAKWKMVRIENKTTIRGGKTQLNMHDGRNIVLPKNEYKTSDVLKIELPSQKVLDAFQFQPGNIAIVIGGAHAGEMSPIRSVDVTRSPKPNFVHFEKGFSTVQDYVFVVGRKDPEILTLEDDKKGADK